MSDKPKRPKDPSRRRFLQTVGAGTVGGALLGNVPAKAAEREPDAHNGERLMDLTVNGTRHRLMVTAETTLAEVIRDHLGLSGTKVACNRGQCGACTVLLDGRAVYSCHLLALDADGREVTTIEGLMDGEELHPIQQAFLEEDGLQCGFCTPGQIMTAAGLLNRHPAPDADQIREGMSGTICRCAAYPNIERSVKTAARKLKGGTS